MDEQTYWIPVRMNRPAYSGAAGGGGPLASDSFTGTDATDLPTYSANWSLQTGETNCRISGNGVGVDALASRDDGNRYSGISWPNNQYSKAVLVTRANRNWSVRCRCSTSVQDYYAGGYNGDLFNSNDMTWKAVGGVFTLLEDSGAQTFIATDVVELDVNGSSIKLFRNGVLRGTGATDTAVTSGQAGIGLFHTVSDTVTYLDTWEGGDFGAQNQIMWIKA